MSSRTEMKSLQDANVATYSERLMNYNCRSVSVSFLLTLAIAISAPKANAAGPNRYLTGSVSYNNASKLYTYSYVVDNSRGVASIGELAVLVDSSGEYVAPDPNLVLHTKPTGYRIDEAVTGLIEEPPYNIVGTMYVWASLNYVDPIPRGGTQGGFSLSVPFPPATGQNNNYFLYSFNNQQVVDYGRVVAPDFRGSFIIPEPASLALAACSCLAIVSVGRKFAAGERGR